MKTPHKTGAKPLNSLPSDFLPICNLTEKEDENFISVSEYTSMTGFNTFPLLQSVSPEVHQLLSLTLNSQQH